VNTFIKSILFGAALALHCTFTAAFDYSVDPEEAAADTATEKTQEPAADAPDEATPETAQETSKKVTKKAPKKGKPKKKKTKSKATQKAKAVKIAAKRKASSGSTSRNVQDQIRLLNEKMDRFESAAHIAPASALADETDRDKTGYIPIQGTNTVIQFGGYVKADAIYDANQFTGHYSNLPNLRLKHLDNDARRGSTFTAHAKQTRISIGTESNTAHGEVMSFIEGDFFGASAEGTTGNFSRSDTSSLNSYNFRVRHAYGSYCFNKNHRVDIGQMWTLFYDPRSAGTTVEFNGPESTAQIRRPQIRYTAAHKRWKMSVSLESGATEYLDISPAFVGSVANGLAAGSPSVTYNSSQYRRAHNSFLGGFSGDGNQALPDLVAQVMYEHKKCGHFTLGGMVRELRIKKLTGLLPNDPAFTGKRYGYGVAVGGRYVVQDKTSLFGQINFGKGIGTYIFALDGYGAAIDSSRGMMQSQFGYGLLVGCEQYWSEHWRTNLIASIARANVSDIVPGGRANVRGIDAAGNSAVISTTGYSISNMMRQIYINLMWSPVEKFEVGIEYAHFRRDTINNYYGYGNRFQFGAFYRF
jgi:hypothetical protein